MGTSSDSVTLPYIDDADIYDYEHELEAEENNKEEEPPEDEEVEEDEEDNGKDDEETIREREAEWHRRKQEKVAAAIQRGSLKIKKQKINKLKAAIKLNTSSWTVGRKYTTRYVYVFARIIIDKAHLYRNPNTLMSESVLQTKKLALHFLSATPMLNHAKDLRGYLHQLFQRGVSLVLRVMGDNDLPIG